MCQGAVMTASAAKQQHTDDTCGYETVDTILLSICAEDIRLPFSKSRIAYGNYCIQYISAGAAYHFAVTIARIL